MKQWFNLESEVRTMEDRRKVLFTDGMSNDFLLIITDATKEAIEKYCVYHNIMMEDGGHFELFDTLKTQYYVKELLDSEVDDREDVEIIGYDELYDFSEYTKRTDGYRTIKITAGMTQEFEIIWTNAPDHVIKAQLMYIAACEEEGKQVPENPYGMIEEFGYVANAIGNQDSWVCQVKCVSSFLHLFPQLSAV